MAFKSKNIQISESNKELLNEFLTYLSQHMAQNSIETYQSAIRRIKHLDWLTCTPTDLIAWRNEYSKSVMDITLQNRLILINVFFKYLKKTNRRQDVPTELLEFPRREVGDEDVCKLITNDLYNELYSDCGVPLVLKVAISLGHTMGLRISEIVALDIKYINFDERNITVKSSKGNKTRKIPMSQIAEKFIRQYMECYKITEGLLLRNRSGDALTTDALRIRFNKIRKRYDIDEEITFHKNRHQFISTLANNASVSLAIVANVAGHSSLKTSQRYIHIDNEEKQRQVLGVFDSMFNN